MLCPSDVTLKNQSHDCFWTNKQSNSRIFQNTTERTNNVAFIYQHDSIMYLYFCSTRLVFPISKSLFARAPVLHLHPSLSPISLQVCLSVFSHLWSLFSAGGGSSGSGNRSVRCHYSSNSVIRHRALPAHAACLARTRRVQLGAWVEIRFDTRRGGLALEGFRGVQEWKWGLELAGDKEGTEIRMDRERGRF